MGDLKMNKKMTLLVFISLLGFVGLFYAHGNTHGNKGWENNSQIEDTIASDVLKSMATVHNYMHGTEYTIDDFSEMVSQDQFGHMMGMSMYGGEEMYHGGCH